MTVETREPADEGDYFVSMTDLMVGLIFVFLILLMWYALQFRDVTDQYTGADRTRSIILKDIQETLAKDGVQVSIDIQNGVLRLPDQILFERGHPELKTPDGDVAVQKLADALIKVLPCYAEHPGLDVKHDECRHADAGHRIESIYIEGHTDDIPFAPRGGIRDNWDLSAERATNTYRALIGRRAALSSLCVWKREAVTGKVCEPILSVSGYGPQRPIYRGADDARKSQNRRIDLRIIMATPDSGETAAAIQSKLGHR
jgi:flagellar motor protein MotB